MRKKRVSIPFDRIQGINFEQNIFHRLLGAVEFHVDTAGSLNREVSLEALSEAKAAKLRDYILRNKTEEVQAENLGKEQEAEEKVERRFLPWTYPLC